ncbi:MAG: D-alanyl-D-alanine carboxypeptidase/D-alanyl-D-alanine-endopeptidase [Sphingobacteriaceae bacterium]|jgi:D-alanyl-D-alanine carboxypeptidase/D-alanyl-D-alanine-endopeptidase (penicillin-binding protein 4)|nr:D-alanyl-D-alanine carboxypeptidase/D-alanyl-D-alanine-endopeptidase [Sphingobacteriaceae bacterium]
MITYFRTAAAAILLTACLQSSTTTSQTYQQKLADAYASFEKDPQLQYGISSLTVLNAETGEVVFAKNNSIGLASASTLKTVTSAAAFYVLGEDFKYQTRLGYSGSLSSDGILNGDLIIIGGGDPTLGSWRYEQTKEQVVLKHWTDAIRKAGIKRINGRVISDDRLFGTQSLPTGWVWQDVGNYYGAGPSSLSWRENQADLIFKPGAQTGSPAALAYIQPAMPQLKFVNEVKTGRAGSGDNVYAFSAPYTDVVYLRGSYGIDLNKPISISVPDPAFEAAMRLGDTLKRIGIAVQQQPTTYRLLNMDKRNLPSGVKEIDVVSSPSLAQIVYWFNQKSINLYGEHLVKTIAWKQGKEATTSNGAEAVKDFWNEKLGIDKNAMNIMDGSGLSPGTRITTLSIAKILQSVKKEPWFDDYYKSIPVYNNMKMKSGSINDVLAYAGYQTTSSGTPLVFSFIINNYNGSGSAAKQKMFKVLDSLK